MRHSRLLAGLLATLTLITSISSTTVFADTKPNYQSLKRIFSIDMDTPYTTIDNEIQNVVAITGERATNTNGKWLDPYVYEHYKIVAYGLPTEKSQDFYVRDDGYMVNGSGESGEYKYLGENKTGAVITNDRYFASGTPKATFHSEDDYINTRWKPINGASDSWKKLTDKQKDALKTNPFRDDDYSGSGYVPTTLTKVVKGDFGKALVQTAPTMWTVEGSVRLEYGNSNWNTIIFDPLARNTTITASVEPDKPSYTMTANMTSITVKYKVKGTVGGDIVTNGMVRQLKTMSFTSLGAVKPTGTSFTYEHDYDDTTQGADFTVTYTRSALKEGSNTKELQGRVSITTDYSTDKEKIDKATGSVDIYVEPKPIVEGTGKIEVRCYDVDTNKEIDGTGNTLTGIKYNTTTTISVPSAPSGYKPAIGGYKSINSTSNKSLMDKPATTQKVTVTKVNSTIFVFFYYEKQPPDPTKPTDPTKPDKPPVPPNYNPIAIIKNPSIVYAGDDVKIDGSKSYDEDGTVEHYEWELPGTDGYKEDDDVNSIGDNATGFAWYPNVGEYEIWLKVTDDDNDIGEELSHITVIPPVPQVVFNVSADKMKENRKITLDVSESTSAKKYPIDWSLTTWTIEPVTGTGATGDYGVRLEDGRVYKNVNGIAQLYSNGTWSSTGQTFNTILKGQKKFQFQARDSGKYAANVTLTNTATFNSTKHYSNTSTREINIVEDLAPIADFSAPSSSIRDRESPNGSTTQKYGIIPVTCTSTSPDGDPISKREWGLRYDSNNNGDFSDETTVYKYSSNLLNAPNFLNMPNNWSTWDSIGAAINYSVADGELKGCKELKATANPTYQSYFLSGVSIGTNTTGKEYTNSAYIKTEDLTSNIYLGIYWLNASGAWIWDSCKYSVPLNGTNDWTKLSVTSIAPVGAVAEYIFIINDTGKGNYSVKLPKIEQGSVATDSVTNNLLPDPKFSNFTGYWACANLNYTLADNELANSKVLQATPNPNSISAFYARAYPNESIVGKKFTYSIYVKTENITGGIYLASYWMNSAGSWVWENCNTTRVISGTNDWTRLEITSTAPQGAVYPYFMIDINGGTGKYWLKAPQVEQSASATEFKVSNVPDLFKSGYKLVVPDEYNNSAEIYWYDVGSYPLSLTVHEEILDSETVKELLVSSDYKSKHVASW